MKKGKEVELTGGGIIRFDEPGQVVEGYAVSWQPSEQDDYSPVLSLQSEDGEIVRLFATKGIQDAVTQNNDLKPTVRNRWLRITYKGKEKLKGGKTFKCFSVVLTPEKVCKDPIPF